MFTFFNRSSKIYLDCFTHDPYAYNLTPICKSVRSIPEWWKELPENKIEFQYNEENEGPSIVNNMKMCYGFREIFKKGIIVNSWGDFHIKSTEKELSWMYSSITPPGYHPRYQYGNGFKDYHHIKLNSPWVFKEKTGVQFVFLAALWNLEEFDFVIPPGILQFTWNGSFNVNTFVPKKDKEYLIHTGQPLAQLIPLTDKKIIIKNHLIDINEYKIKEMPVINSWYGWRTANKLFKKNKENESKCPFGFKKN